MKKVVVDTDIIVDFLRTNGGFLPKLVGMQEEGIIELFLSSVTVMELFAGKSAESTEKLIQELIGRFKVVPFDHDLAKLAGEKKRKSKQEVALADFIIGVTTVSVGAKLATKNHKHFEGIAGLKLFSV